MKKGIWLAILTVLLMAVTILLPVFNTKVAPGVREPDTGVKKSRQSVIDQDKTKTNNNEREYHPASKSGKVTYLVELEETPLLNGALDNGYGSVRDYLLSDTAQAHCEAIKKSQAVAKVSIKKLVSDADVEKDGALTALFNGLIVKASETDKDKLKKIKGVSEVYELYDDLLLPDETIAGTGTESENTLFDRAKLLKAYRSQLGLPEDETAGTGAGTLLAMIDNGFDVSSPAFAREPSQAAVSKEQLSGLYDHIPFAADSGADQVYRSGKIVLAYDYAGHTTDVLNEQSAHGTAAAAIAAGCEQADAEDEGVFRGVACGAQLALMKASEADGESSVVRTAAVLAAMDDAVKLGADVICLGFETYEYSRAEGLYRMTAERLKNAGISLVCSSGNGGARQSGTERKRAAEDVYYGTENKLSRLPGVISAGAAEQTVTVRPVIYLEDLKYYYTAPAALASTSSEQSQTVFNGSENDSFYYTAEFSQDKPFEGQNLTGCLVVLDGKGISELQQAADAAVKKGAGAVALLNVPADQSFVSLRPEDVPLVLLQKADRTVALPVGSGTYRLDPQGEVLNQSDKPSVSPFTSYSGAEDLTIGVRVLAPGSSVYTAGNESEYTYLTGSSAAAAAAAGGYALVKEALSGNSYVGEQLPDLRAAAERAVLLSHSVPIRTGQGNTQVYESPRVQGYGQTNLQQSLKAKALLTVNAEDQGALWLEKTENGYEAAFCLANISEELSVYRLSAVLQTDDIQKDEQGRLYNRMKPLSLTSRADIVFLRNGEPLTAVTAEPGETVWLTVRVDLPEKLRQEREAVSPAGFWLDGYVFAESEDGGERMNLPFSGFCGEPEEQTPFDNTVYDATPSVSGFESRLAAVAFTDDRYAYCPLQQGEDCLYFSPDAVRDYYDDSAYGSALILPEYYLLRDVQELTVTVLDKNGKALYSQSFGGISSYLSEGSLPFEKLLSQCDDLGVFFGKLSAGKYQYRVSARTLAPTGELSYEFTSSYWFELDDHAPDAPTAVVRTEKDRTVLELTAADESGIQGFLFYAMDYDPASRTAHYLDSLSSCASAGYIRSDVLRLMDRRTNDDGSETVRYDITGLRQELSKLSLRMTTWESYCDDRLVAVKAVDMAGNTSEIVAADTLVYGSAEFIFTDQNGRPAEGIEVRVDGVSRYSDRDGRVLFDRLEPDNYYARILAPKDYREVPEDELIHLTPSKLVYRVSFRVRFEGEYPTEESDSSVQKEAASVQSSPAVPALSEETDSPAAALAFVGGLLLISVLLFIFRRRADAAPPEG